MSWEHSSVVIHHIIKELINLIIITLYTPMGYRAREQ